MNRFASKKARGRDHPVLKAALPTVLIGGLLLAFLGGGVASVSRTAENERLKSTRQAVARAAAHAYASQGVYPASLEELEEGYGLQLDHEKYIIDYRCFATNVMPEITVIPKNAGDAG